MPSTPLIVFASNASSYERVSYGLAILEEDERQAGFLFVHVAASKAAMASRATLIVVMASALLILVKRIVISPMSVLLQLHYRYCELGDVWGGLQSQA